MRPMVLHHGESGTRVRYSGSSGAVARRPAPPQAPSALRARRAEIDAVHRDPEAAHWARGPEVGLLQEWYDRHWAEAVTSNKRLLDAIPLTVPR